MTRRFTYSQITGLELVRRLNKIDMKLDTYARLIGWSDDDVKKIVRRDGPVPHWMHLILYLFESHIPNVSRARTLAADIILSDSERPQDGEYPFLEKEAQND